MNIQEQIKKDRDFVMVAVGCHLMNTIPKIDPNYFDQWGYQHFYEMVADIVDEMMFGSNDSEYLKSIEDSNYFHVNHNTCLDWYYMEKSIGMLTIERYRKIAGFD